VRLHWFVQKAMCVRIRPFILINMYFNSRVNSTDIYWHVFAFALDFLFNHYLFIKRNSQKFND